MKSINSLSSIFLCIFFIVLLVACSKPIEADLVVSNVNIINVESGEILSNQDVMIIGDNIAQITQHKRANEYTTANIVDATDKYLIPGLWDMHTHTWWGYEDYYPLLLANGITGIREMFGDLEVANEIKRLTQQDSLIGPDYISSGPIVDGNPPTWGGSDIVNTEEEGREIVRKQVNEGADFIKVYFSLKKEVYKAIADECRKFGIPLAGHIPSSINLSEALKANHSSIEHFWGVYEYCSDTLALQNLNDNRDSRYNLEFAYQWLDLANNTFDSTRIPEMIELLASSDSWICPTLTVHKGFQRNYDRAYRDERVYYMPGYAMGGWPDQTNPSEISEQERKWWDIDKTFYGRMIKLLKPLQDSGVGFLAGTDYSNPYTYPGFSLHEELQIFVEEAGFTPLEALQTSTINPAIFLGKEAEIGTISVGKRASLVLLNQNPLDDIRNTQSISGVILRGRYLPGDSLRAEIEYIAKVNRRLKLDSLLLDKVEKEGIEASVETYHKLAKEQSKDYNFNREQLNRIGHILLRANKVDEAVRIFQLNTEVYPDYGNGWDSLGEGYLAQGDTTKAVRAWETAIRKRNYSTKRRLNDLLLDYKTD